MFDQKSGVSARLTQPAPWKAITGIIGPINVPLEFTTGR